MPAVRLKDFNLGDVDDVEIYAGAAIWDWMQTEDFGRFAQYNISVENMFWKHGFARGCDGIAVTVWADVEDEVAALLKLSGLCQL